LVTALLACVPVLLLVEPPKKRRNVAATMDENEWAPGYAPSISIQNRLGVHQKSPASFKL